MSYEGHAPIVLPQNPLLIVFSGLSGAGKDAVLNRLKDSGYPLEFIVTVTTRARRPGEEDGIHYRFISADDFQKMADRAELLEWANVYGNWYGVPREPVAQALKAGKDVIVKIDVQGATTIKKILPQALFIFLTPPSMEELAERLKRRRTESPSDLELRLKTAENELRQLHLFDYMVVNRQGEIEQAVACVKAIISAEKCRIRQRQVSL